MYQPLGDANPKNFESTHYLRPVERIHFVNNTTAAPELEPAMVRGAEAAKEILKQGQFSGQSNVGMSTRW